MPVTRNDLGSWVGRKAVDPDGKKLGTISDVYVDDDTGEPAWLAVTTGLFGTRVSFVPIEGADTRGDDVTLAYDKATVKDSPNAEANGRLTPQEEEILYRHYGYHYSYTRPPTDGRDDGKRGRSGKRNVRGTDRDEAMTRSEEELNIDKRTREAGRVRLRKWVETEDVNVTVPVRREKARVVTEPISEANADAALTGPDLTSAEHEVVLSEEVVDVDKRVVPKERVRLEKETVGDEVAVNERIRKERIDVEDDNSKKGRSGR